MSTETSIVVAAAIVEREGRFLVTRRMSGTHLEGYWEFPGGKCEPGESRERCLEREMREELGVETTVHEVVHTTRHAYPDRTVELRFYRCDISGEPAPLLGQEMLWADRAALGRLRFPPADEELIKIIAECGLRASTSSARPEPVEGRNAE